MTAPSMFCDPDCKHLSPTEEQQNRENLICSHVCSKYRQLVMHESFHPHLVRLQACVQDYFKENVNDEK